jgi:hypothetical protein
MTTSQIATINRALGIVEGVMMISDQKTEYTLSTAVSMIDEIMNEVTKVDE